MGSKLIEPLATNSLISINEVIDLINTKLNYSYGIPSIRE